MCTRAEDEERAKPRLLSVKVKSLCVRANSVPTSLNNQDWSFLLQTLPPAPADQDTFLWMFVILKSESFF